LIVKLAPSERVIEESQNYYQYIKGNLRGQFYAGMEGKPATFWELGGMLYSFVGAPSKQFSNFVTFYQYQYPQAIQRPLKHLFNDVWGDLYSDSSASAESLFQAYDKIFGLQRRLENSATKGNNISFPDLPFSL